VLCRGGVDESIMAVSVGCVLLHSMFVGSVKRFSGLLHRACQQGHGKVIIWICTASLRLAVALLSGLLAS
jgi:hypothetical protein